MDSKCAADLNAIEFCGAVAPLMTAVRIEMGTRDSRQDGFRIELMLTYPIDLTDDEGTVLVTSPDFLELTTYGDDRDEAIARAVDAIEEAIAARIANREAIPTPSQGHLCVTLPTLTAVKVLLHQRMRAEGITKTELARRLGWHLPQVDRVLDINHHSRLDRMEAALSAFDCRRTVEAKSVA